MATVKGGKGTLAVAGYDIETSDGVPTLHRWEIGRPEVGPNDVDVDIKYCGMCHSDLHTLNGDWGNTSRPMAVGHEISGIVRSLGSEVNGFKIGDRVGVGCMVESCRSCSECKAGLEQHCLGMVQTYSTPFPKGKGHDDCSPGHTNGGYSESITVNETFVYKLPEGISLEVAGPLLCAGVTTYSPLARHVLGKKNQVVGVVGLGGLGHMAVQIAMAMGAKVTVFSRNLEKQAAAEALGATLVAHTDLTAMAMLARSFDVILDTVAAKHDIAGLIDCLKVGCSLVMLGGVAEPTDLHVFPLIFGRKKVEASLIAGVAETKETLDFCAKHKIIPRVKVIPAKEATNAFRALHNGDIAERFVIDVSTIKDMPMYTHTPKPKPVPAKKSESATTSTQPIKKQPLVKKESLLALAAGVLLGGGVVFLMNRRPKIL
eukprot:gb/GEZN01006194.1/.p1 GENE.gb/GEZN01006194.1/~~gb/GEZN01006194.1/.p1  ORF type:complete len:430 (+),score=60.88 gb/GEZN01006194.1/:32-1321(+)